MTVLNGMTWDHPRGYDPLAEGSRRWQELSGVEIHWDRRSLQDFEAFPVAELARQYDLMIIDHPHVGQAVREACLSPLDEEDAAARCADSAAASVGPSWDSYNYAGRQWALPVDAATQVQAWRPDRLDRPLSNWSEVLSEARAGRILMPLRSPHTLLSFFSFAANLGAPVSSETRDGLMARDIGIAALERLRELAALIDPDNLAMDPIAALERLASASARESAIPCVYGYVSYACGGFRSHRLGFANLPELVAGAGPKGATLGGTGIAVSSLRPHTAQARKFAWWIVSPQVQSGIYVAAGGQAGDRRAWLSRQVDAAAGGFYSATLETLDASVLRPRHDGYMAFQHAGSAIIHDALENGFDVGKTFDRLDASFRESLATTAL